MKLGSVICFIKEHGGEKVLANFSEVEIGASLQYFLEQKGMYVITDNDKVVGVICAYIDADDRTIRLYNLVVLPTYSFRKVILAAYVQFRKRHPNVAEAFESGTYKFSGERNSRYHDFNYKILQRFNRHGR